MYNRRILVYYHKMKTLLALVLFFPCFVLSSIHPYVGIQTRCNSLIDCLSTNGHNSICYEGFCSSCRQPGQSCSSSIHCCSGSRCLRYQCTPVYKTGERCNLNRECLDVNDYCINKVCTGCLPLGSRCSLGNSETPCCIGIGVCRSGICQPALIDSQSCTNTFDCSNDLICISGKCQDPIGPC